MDKQVDSYFIETALAFGDYENYKGCCLIKRPGENYVLYIPDSVTEAPSKIFSEPEYREFNLKVIGGRDLTEAKRMFNGCIAKSLDLSSFDTSNVKIMKGMFYECEAESIDFSSFKSKAENMRNMFVGCNEKSLDLSSLDTSKAGDMSNIFDNSNASSVKNSLFDTSNAKSIGNIFSGCDAKSLDLRSFDISDPMKVKSMTRKFRARSKGLSSINKSSINSTGLVSDESLYLSSFSTSKVTDMSYMFACCRTKYLDLSYFNISNVRYMSDIFEKCNSNIEATDSRLIEKYKVRIR